LTLPVSDAAIKASYSIAPIPVSKFDDSVPLAVGMGGTGIGKPVGGATLVGNGTGPMASVPEIMFGSGGASTGFPGATGSLDVAGGIKLAAVDGHGHGTGDSFTISCAEDGWGRPALVLERPGGERIDIASPLRTVSPVVTSVELTSLPGIHTATNRWLELRYAHATSLTIRHILRHRINP
jgi:hypothetical protein